MHRFEYVGRTAIWMSCVAFALSACSEDGPETNGESRDDVSLVKLLERDREFPKVPFHPGQPYELPKTEAEWIERLVDKLHHARTKEGLVLAREILGDMGAPARDALERAVMPLLHRSDSASLAFVTNAVHTLALEPDQAAAHTLIRILDHPLPNIRQIALQGLKLPDDFSIAAPIYQRVEALKEDPIRTTWMLRCLRSFAGPGFAGTLAVQGFDARTLNDLRRRRHPNMQDDEAYRMIAALTGCSDPRIGALFQRMIEDDAYRPYHRQVIDVTPLLADRERAVSILRVATREDRRSRRFVYPLARRALAVLGDAETIETFRDQIGRQGSFRPDLEEARLHRIVWSEFAPAMFGVVRVRTERGAWQWPATLRALVAARRRSTAEAMLAIGMSGHVQDLAPYLTLGDADLRMAAWSACGFAWRRMAGCFPPDTWPREALEIDVPDREAWKERLQRGLLDGDDRIQSEAARQIVLLGMEDAFEVYRDVLRNGDHVAVRQALTTLVRARPKQIRLVPDILERMVEVPTDQSWMYLQAAVPLARPEDRPALLHYLDVDDVWGGRSVAGFAATLMRDLGSDIVPDLIQRIRSANDPLRRGMLVQTLAAAAVQDSRTGEILHHRWTQAPPEAARFLLEEVAFDPDYPVADRLELLKRAPFLGGTAVAPILYERFWSDRIGPGERSWLLLVLHDSF